MKRLMAGLMVAVVMAVVATGTTLLAAGQKGGATTTKQVVTKYPVSITFANRADDNVTSDAKSATYTNGADGVSAYFEVGTTTSGGVTTYDYGKLIFSIGTLKGKIVRTLNLNYSEPVDTGNPSSLAGGAPTGTTTGTYFQVLGRVALLPLNENDAVTIGIQNSTATDSFGMFRFIGGALDSAGYPDRGSTRISALRTSATTWTISTDFDPTKAYLWHYTDNHTSFVTDIGAIAQFEAMAANGAFYGNYNMPFSMTVTCLSAANCPAVGK